MSLSFLGLLPWYVWVLIGIACWFLLGIVAVRLLLLTLWINPFNPTVQRSVDSSEASLFIMLGPFSFFVVFIGGLGFISICYITGFVFTGTTLTVKHASKFLCWTWRLMKRLGGWKPENDKPKLPRGSTS